MSTKVSVIMPSLNVGRYISKCLDSVRNQSLKELEIICVDAGSEDGTLEILKEAAAIDNRIRIINSDRKSYGYQMNLGLAEASGDYIGIIETDDFAEPAMFETLIAAAERDDLDVVKSDFWFYWSVPREKNELYGLPGKFIRMGTFSPVSDITDPMEQADLFNIKPSIWSAVYKRSFLEDNNIRFNETPGASYQDAGFNFKVWACASRARLISDAFLHYRQDNEQSSVNSPSKIYCVCDEYKEIERFIMERFAGEPARAEVLLALMERLKYDSYMWNYERLAGEFKEEFVHKAGEEFAADTEQGYAKEEYFPAFKWAGYRKWAEDPSGYAKELERLAGRSTARKILDRLGRALKK